MVMPRQELDKILFSNIQALQDKCASVYTTSKKNITVITEEKARDSQVGRKLCHMPMDDLAKETSSL